mmetsp:Transcript_6661/g.15550  ORF Transcript_6661/g.15550 Transcript_6661/m.15550 type:complete len:252 (-) Transcript_6661:456-1211(-)
MPRTQVVEAPTVRNQLRELKLPVQTVRSVCLLPFEFGAHVQRFTPPRLQYQAQDRCPAWEPSRRCGGRSEAPSKTRALGSGTLLAVGRTRSRTPCPALRQPKCRRSCASSPGCGSRRSSRRAQQGGGRRSGALCTGGSGGRRGRAGRGARAGRASRGGRARGRRGPRRPASCGPRGRTDAPPTLASACRCTTLSLCRCLQSQGASSIPIRTWRRSTALVARRSSSRGLWRPCCNCSFGPRPRVRRQCLSCR